MTSKPIKLADIFDIFSALSGLSALRLPFEKAMGLAKLQRALTEVKEVYVQQLNTLAQDYGTSIQPNGFMKPPEEDGKRSAFLAELDVLVNSAIEVENTPVTLTAQDFGEQKVSCNEVLMTEGFIEFA